MASLTTLQLAREWLGLNANQDDALLERLVISASDFVEAWLNRTVARADYAEVRDGNGGDRMPFADAPVRAVTSVQVDGRAVPAVDSSHPAGYLFDATRVTLVGYRFSHGRSNVRLAYSAGYDVVPPAIEQATLELIGLRYRERERIGQVSKSIGGETVSFSQKDMSKAIETLLWNYRKVVPL